MTDTALLNSYEGVMADSSSNPSNEQQPMLLAQHVQNFRSAPNAQETEYVLPNCTYIKVYWTFEKRYFVGCVMGSQWNGIQRIHDILYSDGDRKWHYLPCEFWLERDDSSSG